MEETIEDLLDQLGADSILEQLEREGSWGKYQLVRPKGGSRGQVLDR